MSLAHYSSIIFLLILLLLQWRAKSFLERHGKQIYLIALAGIAATLIYDLHASFTAIITSDPPNRYYGPPYTSIASFLFSSWSRVIGPYALSSAMSLLALWGMTAPARYRDRFEAGEPYLIAISLLTLRHPFWMVFVVLALVFYILASSYLTIRHGSARRISWYYAWLPLSIITLACAPLLATITVLNIIGFSNVY